MVATHEKAALDTQRQRLTRDRRCTRGRGALRVDVQMRLGRGTRIANLSQQVSLPDPISRLYRHAALPHMGEHDLGLAAAQDNVVAKTVDLIVIRHFEIRISPSVPSTLPAQGARSSAPKMA